MTRGINNVNNGRERKKHTHTHFYIKTVMCTNEKVAYQIASIHESIQMKSNEAHNEHNSSMHIERLILNHSNAIEFNLDATNMDVHRCNNKY